MRPQFSLKTLLWLVTLVSVATVFARPHWHKYAPAWGRPSWVRIDEDWWEAHYWTGRREVDYFPGTFPGDVSKRRRRLVHWDSYPYPPRLQSKKAR